MSTTTKQASHLIIEALAGTGKTTTLVEGLKAMRGLEPSIDPSPQQAAIWQELADTEPTATVAFVAFNKSIATELQRRVPANVQAMTMHSMGMQAVRKMFGKVRVNQWRVDDILSSLMGKDIRELRKEFPVAVRAIKELVGLCKLNLVDENDPEFTSRLGELIAHHEVDVNGSAQMVTSLVPQVLTECRNVDEDWCIDFNDMVWLPVALNMPMERFDLLMVDEAQDLNRCQQALARRAGDRLVFCGDPHQAIYGFAGADSESMRRLEAELGDTDRGVRTLPLTVTRRCPVAVVAEANTIIEGFEAHESNEQGAVTRAALPNRDNPTAPNYTERVQSGDMILCRCNAPLVSECFRFLRAGKRADILGRDIGQGLIRTVEKMKAKDIPDLVEKLDDWRHQEETKELKKRNPSEGRIININDRYACLVVFAEGATTPQQVTDRIKDVFKEGKDAKGIRLSSIHKAKGLEANRVFLLEPETATVPHPMAKAAWQVEQEWNLRYVAITRAQRELVYVR